MLMRFEGQSLDRMPMLSEHEKLLVLRQMLSALSFLHKRSIVHNDVKPANITYAHGRAVLIDFAFAGEFKQAGTTGYLCPCKYTRSARCDGKTDVFALGLSVWELFLGELTPLSRQQLSMERVVMPLHLQSVPTQLASLLWFMLRENHAERIDATQALAQCTQLCKKDHGQAAQDVQLFECEAEIVFD
jgi:serine/threonine protein kinase